MNILSQISNNLLNLFQDPTATATPTVAFRMENNNIQPQMPSPLFSKIPAEIRTRIFSLLLSPSPLHITRLENGRLSHVRCQNPSEPITWKHRCWGFPVANATYYHGPDDSFPSDDGNMLPLLQTCRRVYAEAVAVLYGQNIFDLQLLENVIALPLSMPRASFDMIRAVRLSWFFYLAHPLYIYPKGSVEHRTCFHPPYDEATWEQTWAVFAGMRGLRSLRVWLVQRWMERLFTGEVEQMIMEPACHVKGLDEFDIWIDWDKKGNHDGAPFKLKRW